MIDTIACVYKSGGDTYTLEYVERLMSPLKKYNVRLVCLSDDPNVANICEYIPLKHNEWSGWWSKLELFQNLHNCLYFDLDTVIRGDISSLLAADYTFTMLSDFGNDLLPASGVMAWQGDYSFLSVGFDMSLDKNYRRTGMWGDQGWIREKMTDRRINRFQTDFPDMFGSYKLGYNQDTEVVCFHGLPRPHTVNWKV